MKYYVTKFEQVTELKYLGIQCCYELLRYYKALLCNYTPLVWRIDIISVWSIALIMTLMSWSWYWCLDHDIDHGIDGLIMEGMVYWWYYGMYDMCDVVVLMR